MTHTARVIHNPATYAHVIVHRHEHIQHEQRLKFIEQHKIIAVGSGSIAFSVICCDDPATAERHTIAIPPGASADDIRVIMEHKAKLHAERHAAVSASVEIVKDLAEKGVECTACK